MQKFQVIENLNSNTVITSLSVTELAAVIRVGGGIHGVPNYRQAIIDLRNETDEGKQKEIKATRIPAFIPSVNYPSNSRAKGQAYDVLQYMVLDVDGKDNRWLKSHGAEFNGLLPGVLVFLSPKADGGRKLLIPVHLRNKYDYQTAYTEITAGINASLTKRGKQEIKFDKDAAKVTQTCLFSWDKEPVCEDMDTVQPRYGAIITKPQREANSALTEAEWSSVDTTNVTALFASTVGKLAAGGVVWGKGTDAFIMEIVRLKLYGVGLAELLNMVHNHANGVYSRKHQKKTVTEKVTRLYNEYFSFVDTAATPAPVAGNSFVFNNYITEHINPLWQHLQAKRVVYIDAPTGGGKTTLIKALAGLSGLSVDLLCPTTALAQQQHGDGVLHITGDGMLQAEHYDAPVLACCFESIAKIRKRQADILVIDEAHELASAYNYRSKAIQSINEYGGSYKYVVYLSGSMFPILTDKNTDNLLTFSRQQAKQIPYNVVTLGKQEKDADYFTSTLAADALNVFYKNDKAQLTALSEYLTAKGYKVLLVCADNKDDEGYKTLISAETLQQYDVVLTTCLLQSGVNIQDTRPVRIVFGRGCNVLDYIQFTARFRVVIPTVEIIHSGEVNPLRFYNDQYVRVQVEAVVNGLEKAKKINENMTSNQKSYLKPVVLDGTCKDENGNYAVDEWYLLHERHKVYNWNTEHNINTLRNELNRVGFVFQQHIYTTAPELLKETQQRVKQLTKEKRETIAAGLIDATYSLTKAAGKEERELHARFTRLARLEIASIKADMLTSDKEYTRTCERALYEHLRYNKANGYALNEKAELWYSKVDTIQQQVKPGTYDADTLKAIVRAATGKQHDQSVNDTVGLLYDVTRKRVGTRAARRYEYHVSPRQAVDLTQRVGVVITDDFFDFA